MNDPRIQALFKQSRHTDLFIVILSQHCYELLKGVFRANGDIYHIFKPKNFRDFQNLYQDKTRMDTTLNEFNFLTSTCMNKIFQPPTIAMTIDKFTGRFRLELKSFVVPDTNPFQKVK